MRDAQFAARMAELGSAIRSVEELERRLAERLTTLRDGRDGADGRSVAIDDVRPVVAEYVEQVLAGWDRPKDGQSVTVDDVEPVLRDMVEAAVARIPIPRDGLDGKDGVSVDPDVVRQMIADAVALIPPAPAGKDGADGRDGTSVDPAEVRQWVADAVALIPAPKDGRDGADGKDGRDGADGTSVDRADVERMVADAVAMIPPAPAGKDADPELVAELVGEKVREAVAALPPPEKGEKGDKGEAGPMGSLPIVDPYQDRVYYEGEACTYDGGVYQAVRDTGKVPGHADWRCIVARGMDGAEGKEGKQGPQGKQGKPGQRGERGAGAIRARLSEDGQHQITTFSDGTEVVCDMYPVFSKVL